MQERDTTLIGHLKDAWAFETRLMDLVLEQVKGCQDAPSRRMYREHARLTKVQCQRIQRRLEALGEQVLGAESGWFSDRLKRMALEVAIMDVWRDESTQRLITSYGIKQLECNMYRSLLELAESTDDEATASLARTSLEEEEATARRLLFCIGMATRGRDASNAA